MIVAGRGASAGLLRGIAPVAGLAVAATVLRQFPPSESGFYPRCPVYTMLNLQCPGCGGTRAVAALLHGRVGEAVQLNGLVVLLLPVALWYGLRWYWGFLRCEAGIAPRMPAALLSTIVAATVVFTIVRNWRAF